MKKAYILYKKSDAERNGVLIGKYFAAIRRRSLAPSLVITDRLPREAVFDLVSDGAFVIDRGRDALLARYLEERGLRVSNPSIVTETANDKLLTYERLHETAPMLETRLLTEAEPQLDYPFVAKPAGGHGGSGVTLIRTPEELEAYRAAHPEKSVVQPFADAHGRDMRVYVIGGKPAAVMLRESDGDFRSNFSLGGSAKTVPVGELKEDETAIVNAVCSVLPLEYAGVDVIRDGDKALLNEIEDPVGARMLYIYTDVDPAERHVEEITRSI